MKIVKQLLFFSSFFLLTNCSNENTISDKDSTETQTDLPGEEITEEGFEGRIQCPEKSSIDAWNSYDQQGGNTRYILVQLKVEDGYKSFKIERGNQTLDSLKLAAEKDEFDIFAGYVEESDRYFIAQTVRFVNDSDTSYIFGVVTSKNNSNYFMLPANEIKEYALVKTMVDCALTYEPK